MNSTPEQGTVESVAPSGQSGRPRPIATSPLKLVALRLVTLVALAATCASLLDYLLPSPAFCGFKAGCDEVFHSAYGRLLGVPLPVIGLLAFGGFYALTLFPRTWMGRLIGPAALTAGFCGMGLIALQLFVIGRLCPLCMITDAAALLLAAVELGMSPAKPPSARPQRPWRWLWTGAAALAIVCPLLWPLVKPIPSVPEQVKAYWEPGKITVVEVTDFECPYCRRTHPVLEEFLRKHEDLEFVRLVRPVDEHANAWPAARAYHCASRQGRGSAMAKTLFQADDLGAESRRAAAESLRLDMARFRDCTHNPATDERIEERTAWVENSDIQGLPVIWVQDQRLVGAQTPASLLAALARVRRDYPHGYRPGG